MKPGDLCRIADDVNELDGIFPGDLVIFLEKVQEKPFPFRVLSATGFARLASSEFTSVKSK